MNALADAIAAPFGVDVATRSAPEAPPPAPQATAATTAAAQHEPQFPQPHPPAEHSSSPNPSPRSSRHHVAMQPHGDGGDDTAGDAMDGGASDGHASWADGAHLVAGGRRPQPPPPTVPPPGMPLGLRQSHGRGGDGLGASGHDAFSHGIVRVEPPVPPAPVARSVPPPQPSQLPWRWPPVGAPADAQFSVPVAPQPGIEQVWVLHKCRRVCERHSGCHDTCCVGVPTGCVHSTRHCSLRRCTRCDPCVMRMCDAPINRWVWPQAQRMKAYELEQTVLEMRSAFSIKVRRDIVGVGSTPELHTLTCPATSRWIRCGKMPLSSSLAFGSWQTAPLTPMCSRSTSLTCWYW